MNSISARVEDILGYTQAGVLTESELEVLALMKEGLTNRAIGERLVVSGSTVTNHVSSIPGKLGTTSRTQAVALAVEHRIVAYASRGLRAPLQPKAQYLRAGGRPPAGDRRPIITSTWS